MENTFPCYYSTRNPWIVIARYNRYLLTNIHLVIHKEYSRDDTVTSILVSFLVPNIIFIISVAILVYW